MGSGACSSGYDYSFRPSTVKRSASSYNIQDDRRYDRYKSTGIPAPKRWNNGNSIYTSSPTPLVVAVDVTGSMKDWPEIIFEKLAILYHEAKIHLPENIKNNFEISFAALGDAYCDNDPIQIGKFGRETREEPMLREVLNSIRREGGGGGQGKETYELIAYYYSRHCEMPNLPDGKKPVFVFTGDEGYYKRISSSHVRNLIGDTLGEEISSKQIFDELQEKFDVYILRKDCSDNYSKSREEKVQRQWEDTLGTEKVLGLSDPRRIADNIIGIVAASYGDWDHFKERITKRQTEKQVEEVMGTIEKNVSTVYNINTNGGDLVIGDGNINAKDSVFHKVKAGKEEETEDKPVEY